MEEEHIVLETKLGDEEISKWIEKLNELKDLENEEHVHLESKEGEVIAYHK